MTCKKIKFWWGNLLFSWIWLASARQARSHVISKADSGPARWACAPRFWKSLGFVFGNFDCKTRIYFDFSQHTMFTIWFYSPLTTETYGMCEGTLKQTILPRRDRVPRFLFSWIRHCILQCINLMSTYTCFEDLDVILFKWRTSCFC